MQIRRYLGATSLALLITGPGHADPKPCSLRCESIRAPTSSALDLKGIAATNKRLQSDFVTGTTVSWSVHMLGVAFSGIPVAGAYIEEGYEWEANQIKEGSVRQLVRGLEADVRRRLGAGATAASVQTDLRPNAEATIRDLIGPNSQYPDIAADKTAYDTLQDAAISVLAAKIDDVINTAASGESYSDGLRVELQTKLNDLKSLRTSLEAQHGGKGSKDVDPEAAAQAMKAPKTAAAKQAAAEAELDRQYRDLATKAKVASDQFKAAAVIFQNVGASPEAVAAASKLSVLAGVVSGYAESQYNPAAILPTIAAATSLFGGATQGPDPYLVAILASLDQLHAKVDALRRESLGYHMQEMAEIGTVQTGLVGLVGLLQLEQEKDLNQCLSLIPETMEVGAAEQPLHPEYAFDQMPGYGYGSATLLNALQLRPTTYEALKSLWLDRADELKACRAVLGELYVTTADYKDLPKPFQIADVMAQVQAGKTSLPSNIAAEQSPYHAKYQASLAVKQWTEDVRLIAERSRRIRLGSASRNELMWSFAQPARSLEALEIKADRLNELVASNFRTSRMDEPRAEEFDRWALGPAVDADLVSRTASYMLLSAWWREFTDATGLRDPDKITEKQGSDVVRRLVRTGDLLRIAVAQQGSISGDALLLSASDRLEGRVLSAIFQASPGLETDATDVARVKANSDWWTNQAQRDFDRLAEANTVFASNLGHVLVAQRLRSKQVTLVQYELAWATGPNSFLLSQLIGPAPGSYVFREKRWFIERTWDEPSDEAEEPPRRRIALIPLPSPDQLRDGVLRHTASLRVAATLLGQTQQEAGLYQFAPADPAAKAQAIATARARALPF